MHSLLLLKKSLVKSLGFLLLCGALPLAQAGTKHSAGSRYPSYQGRVMCGYQGWFRAEGDGSGEGWGHYAMRGKFGPGSLHVDVWPEVSEYPKTYPTAFKGPDGQPARVFSSWDESSVDLHFRWMQDYQIDGVFVQRFFGVTRKEESRRKSRVLLEHALKASRKYGRAIAVMYDLSGLRASGEDCASIMQDWKELVDQLKLTSQGTNQTYLYHQGKPLVAIWGLGFPDRPYNLRNIGIDKLIEFFKNDPEYGGCAVMLGVPTYFRELAVDCLPDPYLHEVMASAHIIMPWMVQRFTPLVHAETARYAAQIKADLAWCAARHLEYVPCVYPGFSWYHLSKVEFGGVHPLNQIPRQKGKFYWDQISTALEAGVPMLYVAMFDEMDEGTAIFKCASNPCIGEALVDMEGMPSDHYLWLTGRAGKMLRREMSLSKDLPRRGE